MYTYINKNEIESLYYKNRKAIVIPEIQTKDINEYINSLSACFNSIGINPSIFTLPKIIGSHKNNGYTLVLILRDRLDISENEFNSMIAKITSIVPTVMSVKHYINYQIKC